METDLRQHVACARLLLLLVTACCIRDARPGEERELDILGWVEQVRLLDPDIVFEAKLDSGAETSSLSAEVIKKFRRGGERWVRFRILDPATGESHIIVRKRVRTVAVIQHDGERQRRPVVRIGICIAGRTLTTEVSLIDRSEFAYQLLLGRNTLETFALIDPAGMHLSEPRCRSDDAGTHPESR